MISNYFVYQWTIVRKSDNCTSIKIMFSLASSYLNFIKWSLFSFKHTKKVLWQSLQLWISFSRSLNLWISLFVSPHTKIAYIQNHLFHSSNWHLCMVDSALAVSELLSTIHAISMCLKSSTVLFVFLSFRDQNSN
mgnify:CR=1 FL=1